MVIQIKKVNFKKYNKKFKKKFKFTSIDRRFYFRSLNTESDKNNASFTLIDLNMLLNLGFHLDKITHANLINQISKKRNSF